MRFPHYWAFDARRVVAVGMSVLLLAGCAGPAPLASTGGSTASSGSTVGPAAAAAPAGTAEAGGTLTVAQSSDAGTLDPQKQGKMPDMNILINMFDTLVSRDANNQLAPGLATEWKVVDPTTWEFKLRDGVKFHNGEAFDAQTVRYSIERLKNPATKSPIVELTYVKEVKVVDDRTVDFLLSAPDPILPNKLTLFGGVMVPPQYIQEQGDDAFSQRPVGTGPFKFVSWQKDNQVVMEANPEYWGGKPRVSKLVFRAIPNAADMIAAVKTGEVDIAANITPDAASQLKGVSDRKVVSAPGIRDYFVEIDTRQAGPLADARVRQALNYGVDVDTLVKTVLGGSARRTPTLVPMESFGFDPQIQAYPYDVQKAKELLAEAGHPNGFDTTLDAQMIDKDIVQAIAGSLAKIGVRASVNLMEAGTFNQKLLANELRPLYYIGNTGWTMDVESNFQSYLKSDRRYNRWPNPQADQLVTTEETSVNPDERKAAFSQLQLLLKDQAPFIYLYQTDNIYGMTPRVTWAPNPVGVLLMKDASVS